MKGTDYMLMANKYPISPPGHPLSLYEVLVNKTVNRKLLESLLVILLLETNNIVNMGREQSHKHIYKHFSCVQ